MKTTLSIFSFFVYLSIFSQTTKITYQTSVNLEEYRQQNSDLEIIKSMDAFLSQAFIYDLYYKEGISLFLKEKKADFDTGKIIEVGATDQVYKNQKENLYIKQADLFGKDFLVTDKLSRLNWTLVDEEKKVGSYLCKKAITLSDGITVEAWYTPEIAIPDGPADYWGLPGLIVELTHKNLTYKLISINYNSDYAITKPTIGKKINKVDFLKLEKEKIKELENGIFDDDYK